MNTKIDWHYHLTGRNIKKDIITLKGYLFNMDEVYVMASYFPENRSGLSNYNLYYHLKDMRKVKLYLSLDFEYYFYQGYNEIVSILEENSKKIVGIKIYTGYQNIEFKEEFDMVMKLAKKYKLYVMFHTGYLKGNKEQYSPMELTKVFRKYPDIKFILAHLSNPFSTELIYILNNYKNVQTDISGLVDSKKEIKETIKYAKNIYDKVEDKTKFLFGTDYPMQDYKTTMNFVFDIISHT